MTITRHTPVRAAGCTCVHAANLHQQRARTIYAGPGCAVGWSGAGEPDPDRPGRVRYPSGCTCIATGAPVTPQVTLHA